MKLLVIGLVLWFGGRMATNHFALRAFGATSVNGLYGRLFASLIGRLASLFGVVFVLFGAARLVAAL